MMTIESCPVSFPLFTPLPFVFVGFIVLPPARGRVLVCVCVCAWRSACVGRILSWRGRGDFCLFTFVRHTHRSGEETDKCVFAAAFCFHFLFMFFESALPDKIP